MDASFTGLSYKYPKLFALGAALIVAMILWAIDHNERELAIQKQKVEVIEKLVVLRAKLGTGMTSNISAARVLAVNFATKPDLSEHEFNVLAAEVANANPSIRNLVLVKGTVASYVYPYKGNEKILGADYRKLPKQWPVYQKMMDERAIQIAGPLTLVQGGTGLVVRIPVYQHENHEAFLGSIAMVVNYEPLLEQSDLKELQKEINLAIRGRDAKGSKGEVFLGDDQLFTMGAVTQSVVLPGGSWELAALPYGGWQGSTRLSRFIEIFGFILCLMAWLLSYQSLLRRRQRELNERELKQSEALLRLRNEALSATSQGVLIASGDGHINYVNLAACQLSGYDQDSLQQKNLADLFEPAVASLFADENAGRKQMVLEYSRTTEEGRQLWLELLLTPVYEPDEKNLQIQHVQQYVALLRDITDKKLADQELQIAAMAFETEEGILITDANLVILRVNHAFTRITGYESDEAVGQSTRMLQSGRHDELFYKQMWDEIRLNNRWHGELWNRRKNGEIYSERLVISAVLGRDGKVSNYVGSFNDITEHKVSEERIHQLAFYDPLTGLPNRRLLLDRLARALSLSRRHQRYGAILMIDLDNFKTLNDTQGHYMGDQLLAQIGKRIHACVRSDDTVSRTGGDEFVVLLEGLHEELQHAADLAENVAEKIRKTLSETFNLGHIDYDSSGSMGITMFGVEAIGIDELLRRADMAMYQAKASGKNNVRFFDPSMQAALEFRTAMETDLRQALAYGQFILHYQLQVSALGDPIGAEVLLRWRHPVRGLVSPLDFIPLAEETGMILPIGLWVLETACKQIATWKDDPVKSGMQLAVNVSARQFRHPGFVDDVKRILQETGANPILLKLELTESVVLEDVAIVIEKMQAIKILGVGFSMDDFGTGYSSLSYLQRLPLTQLKIDRSFVHNLPDDVNNANIVRTIISLGASLDLNVIAEGVETEQQRDFLLQSGCQAYQGYLFCKPVPIEEFDILIASRHEQKKADSPSVENQVS
ncbi:EAL domain-containing protein [Undibacterium sp. TS12]|uniref:bifunctional diguanylate cyclase/phosphodiesterase n=1 Tax=Undibacterium sp. TS12 TaxID=2908202 RepID=UPI001F4CD29B|nr:EAL domain-containing protein [Undibacterium sp. TS12]MCH8622315.1 EAL domain-containing protein [Undibacterium sp. TS12]